MAKGAAAPLLARARGQQAPCSSSGEAPGAAAPLPRGALPRGRGGAAEKARGAPPLASWGDRVAERFVATTWQLASL